MAKTHVIRQDTEGHFSSITIAGVAVDTAILLASGQVVDLNGEADALVFDADADTSMSSPTDDQIDIEVSGADDFRITANTFTALSGSTIATNTIAETTAASGVTIDGVLVKDGGAVFADGAAIDVDIVNEATATAGVTLDGVLLKDGGIVCADAATLEVDTVNEATSAAGVTVDGMAIKDGRHSGGRTVQTLTATGAITLNSGAVLLDHATVIIAATLDAPIAGDELFIIDSSASGTAAHTVTAAAGVTWDGTNNTATLNAPGEALHVVATSATRWFILENVGSVALSSV